MRIAMLALAVGAMTGVLVAGCGAAPDGSVAEDLGTATDALGVSGINQARFIDTSKIPTTTDYWLPTAREKAKSWGLPVSVQDYLSAGLDSAQANLTFCTGAAGNESCSAVWVSVTRTGLTYVPYPSLPSHQFALRLVDVNGQMQWTASEIVGGRAGTFGVQTWYTGRYE